MAAAATLIARVLEAPGLLDACTAYQDGDTFNRYGDGDVAASQGHLSLLQLKHSSSSSSLCCNHSHCCCLGEIAEDADPGRHDSSVEREEEEEGGDGGILSRGGGALGGMTFTHCAVDWAATQGHLEVVRYIQYDIMQCLVLKMIRACARPLGFQMVLRGL